MSHALFSAFSFSFSFFTAPQPKGGGKESTYLFFTKNSFSSSPAHSHILPIAVCNPPPLPSTQFESGESRFHSLPLLSGNRTPPVGPNQPQKLTQAVLGGVASAHTKWPPIHYAWHRGSVVKKESPILGNASGYMIEKCTELWGRRRNILWYS